MSNLGEKYRTPQRVIKPDPSGNTNIPSTAVLSGSPQYRYTKQFHDGNVSVKINRSPQSFVRHTNSPYKYERATQRTERTYPSRYIRYNDADAYNFGRKIYRRDGRLIRLPQEDLHSIIIAYENQIHALLAYINQSQILQRQRIIQIFGQNNREIYQEQQCDCNIQESKVILGQLSQKVKSLIHENQVLKSREKSRVRTTTPIKTQSIQDELLLKQNKKLRAIIEDYRRSSAQLPDNSKQIYDLNRQINQLRQENNHLNISISNLRQSQMTPQPTRHTQQEIQFTKGQLTKNIFQYSQGLQKRMGALKQQVDEKQNKIKYIESILARYEKQRNFKIDSTIRKSYMLSQSLKRPAGDVDFQKDNRDEEMVKDVRQSFVRRISSPPVIYEEQHNPHLSLRSSVPVPVPNQSQIRQLHDRYAMLQLKNKNLISENQGMLRTIRSLQGSINMKNQRILELQRQMHHLQRLSHSQQQIVNPEVQQEIRLIRKILQDCNITNYQRFFKQINDIIQQRDLMKSKIDEYQAVSSKISKGKRTKTLSPLPKDKNILQQKVYELVQQNKRLVNKIAHMESQMQKYYQQIMDSQLQKLNEISFLNESVIMDNGKAALDWQKIVRQSIEKSIIRLQNLEGKIVRQSVPVRKQHVVVTQSYRTSNRPQSFIRFTYDTSTKKQDKRQESEIAEQQKSIQAKQAK